eukprot:GHVP01060907.1.p1 GENE.GHVP01060907.1~~GHVP01060907.1.p1  ORF type:complete len:130 (+),score=26.76 GHVP01060907.1:253-642(+)
MLESANCFDTPPLPPVEVPQETKRKSRLPNFSQDINSLAPNDQVKSLRQSSDLSRRRGRESSSEVKEDAMRRSSSLRKKSAWKEMAKRSLNAETSDFPLPHAPIMPKAEPSNRRVRLHQPNRDREFLDI